ncbi:MAG: response regulator [Anaeromyxobacter sp.]|nr:response regulator [Anaeromyxobacter sp.]MBL0276144.1 response regulator [Anaeromyxobacter sp.]
MRRYLIVDDNRQFAENLAEILRDRGDEVIIAGGGREALDRAATIRFDALLTDMRMPVMGGAELVHEVRRLDPGLAALVITAHVGDDALEAARSEGLLAVLPKPVPVGRLLDLLASARRDGLVVIVEDDQRLSDNLTEALRSRGFAAVTAASVLETERLGPVRPFAALVDLRVPGGPDGEAMRRLGARFPGLPMIVMTGLHDQAPPPTTAFFLKPFDTGALLDAVGRLHAARAGATPAGGAP